MTLAQPKGSALSSCFTLSLSLVGSCSEISQIRSQQFTKSPEWGTMEMNHRKFYCKTCDAAGWLNGF